jgi:hypothetical protein
VSSAGSSAPPAATVRATETRSSDMADEIRLESMTVTPEVLQTIVGIATAEVEGVAGVDGTTLVDLIGGRKGIEVCGDENGGVTVALHVRVDSHVYSGYRVPPYYDSLIAKLIVWGENRDEAIARGRRALDEFIITGIPTTIPFHERVVNNAAFQSGEFYTDFVDREFGGL